MVFSNFLNKVNKSFTIVSHRFPLSNWKGDMAGGISAGIIAIPLALAYCLVDSTLNLPFVLDVFSKFPISLKIYDRL